MRSADEQEILAKLEAEPAEQNELVNLICETANLPKRDITEFNRRREIHELIHAELKRQGEFFRTSEDQSYYFLRSERRVFSLAQAPFANYLKQISGLSETEHYFRFSLDMLRAQVGRTAPQAEVHAIAYFDPATKRHVVSDGGSGVWWREPGGDWRLGHNGQDRIYFATEPNAESFYPDRASADDENLAWFWQQFLFENAKADDGLTAAESQLLMRIWLLQQLFPVFRATRIIPAFLGPQGSGKTTAAKLIGRLLVGCNFNVTGIQENKESDWTAAVSNRMVVSFDNADSRIKWLPDQLARYATGQRFQLRKLYSNNEELSFAARAIILLTSRDPHFNRPDVAERLLPLTFSRPKEYTEEFEIFEQLTQRRNQIWGELLKNAAYFADALDLTKPARLKFRMADYATFGLRALGEPRCQEWKDMLDKLSRTQSQFATEGDSITITLLALLDRQKGIIGPMTTGELFNILQPIARELKLWFPDTADGFGKMLLSIKTAAESELNADITITGRVTGGKRRITIKGRDRLL